MITKSIVVTVADCRQVGPDDWWTYRASRVFSEKCSIRDILAWACSELNVSSVSISSLVLSEYTGESI